MEENQLNLNAPIISARRYSSPVRPSEKVNIHQPEKSLPRRQSSQPVQMSDWEPSGVAKPGTVPFVWEKIPGKAKEENEPGSQTNIPRLPPRIERTPLNISGNLLEMMKKGTKGDCENHSESGDDRYSDALDALSLSDSRSMSCSVSGLSGYCGSDIKSRGTFSTDVQTRDFMMNRFLPAAKAMILKTPQYSSKKPNVAVEQPKEPVKKVVSTERSRVEHDWSLIVPDYGEYIEETESENGIDEFVAYSKTPKKAFGLFSKFCKKNSLCLLNPVPGLKARNHSPTNTPKKSSTKKNQAKEVSKTIRKAYSGPLTQTSDKYSGNGFTRKRVGSISRSQELYTVKSKPSGDSPTLSHSGELRMARGSSPYRAYTRGGLSPYRNEVANSPFRKGTSFIGIAKNGEKIEVVKNPIIPKIEKTVGIDQVQNTNGLNSFREGVKSDEKLEKKNEIILKADDKHSADVSGSLATLHPPLPKSPSESWLWRTLPSINFGRTQFLSKNKQANTSNAGTKWETIVKTSNVLHDHIRYSEELVPHLLQHRKT